MKETAFFVASKTKCVCDLEEKVLLNYSDQKSLFIKFWEVLTRVKKIEVRRSGESHRVQYRSLQK